MNSEARLHRRPAPTPERLLAAGRVRFARHGYDGAAIRAITRDAHANLGAVTYHFGSKRALYEAVLEQVLAPLAEGAMRAPGEPLDRVEATVHAFFEHLQANPDIPLLMFQEVAAGGHAPPPVARVLGVVSGHLAALIREGQASGKVREGDPLLLGLSVIAQLVHLTFVRRVARNVVGLDQSDAGTRARVVEHAARFASAGLAARKEDS